MTIVVAGLGSDAALRGPQQEQPEQQEQQHRFSGGDASTLFLRCVPVGNAGRQALFNGQDCFSAEAGESNQFAGKMAGPIPFRVQFFWGRTNNNGRAPKIRSRCAALFWGYLAHMFNDLISWDNLLLAYRRAAKGKRGQANVAGFEHRLEDNLWQLRDELADQSYRPGPYVSFTIHEPKRRLISAAPFRDRVVHHALCNLIEPIFERSFIVDSYANRVGKGTHRALDRCQSFARRYRYALQCDIRQFFPSIDHAILRRILATKIVDPDVMWLAGKIVDSGIGVLSEEYEMTWFPGDNLLAATRPRGLPIGNLTSQFWANCYLNPFDYFIKRELGCKAYLRFVDDFALFADDKAVLWQWRQAIVERLARLRLTIHPAAQPRKVSKGLSFLGFLVFSERRRLKRRKGIHYRQRLNLLVLDYVAGKLSFDQLAASVRGWVNHARYGNTVGLRKAVLLQTVIPARKEAL